MLCATGVELSLRDGDPDVGVSQGPDPSTHRRGHDVLREGARGQFKDNTKEGISTSHIARQSKDSPRELGHVTREGKRPTLEESADVSSGWVVCPRSWTVWRRRA